MIMSKLYYLDINAPSIECVKPATRRQVINAYEKGEIDNLIVFTDMSKCRWSFVGAEFRQPTKNEIKEAYLYNLEMRKKWEKRHGRC